MSYNLRVRFKNNVLDQKKIARIEHYFKLKIPASKAFREYNQLNPSSTYTARRVPATLKNR